MRMGTGDPRGDGNREGHVFKACRTFFQPEKGNLAHSLNEGSEAPREGDCPGCLWVVGAGETEGQRGEGQHPSSH